MSIVWRVENPFRLFTDPAATAQHRAAFANLPPGERHTPILATERRLASAYPRGWAESWIEKLCWIDASQRYGCPTAQTYAHPESHRVIVDLDATPDTACVWTVHSEAQPTAAPMKRVNRPCREAFTIVVPYPGGAAVSVTSSDGRSATTNIRVRDLFVIGIGDSFASGDGNPDVPVRFDDRRSLSYRSPGLSRLDGYPSRTGAWSSMRDAAFRQNGPRWLSSACHRSLYGHHLRAGLQLALEDPHRAITFASFACWGSDIVNGLFLPIKPTEIVPDLPRVAQLSAVADLQCHPGKTQRKEWPRAFEMSGRLPELVGLAGLYCPPEHSRRIDLLLVAVGGNDIGFAQLVASAVMRDATPMRQISGWFGQLGTPAAAQTALAALPERYKALKRAAHTILHIPWNEADRIVLTGYPPIALDDETHDACEGGSAGMSVTPAFSLDQQRTRDSERIGRDLYMVMRLEAVRLGWTFVDGHRDAFVRHGLCAGRPDRLANPADGIHLPRFQEGQWHPFPPSQWEPYAPRRRWVRTPNDGYMTVNFHEPKLADDPMNLMLASSYSGGFHPTAEGQAAMADAVVAEARAALARYEAR